MRYEPDFLVRLANGTTVAPEIKRFEDDQTKAKHNGANRWVTPFPVLLPASFQLLGLAAWPRTHARALD